MKYVVTVVPCLGSNQIDFHKNRWDGFCRCAKETLSCNDKPWLPNTVHLGLLGHSFKLIVFIVPLWLSRMHGNWWRKGQMMKPTFQHRIETGFYICVSNSGHSTKRQMISRTIFHHFGIVITYSGYLGWRRVNKLNQNSD